MTATKMPTVAASSRRMSALDKWLPVWIGLAMLAGLLLGRFVPVLADVLTQLEIGGVSVPIALGLLVMMYPVLAKVRYDKVVAVTGDKKTSRVVSGAELACRTCSHVYSRLGVLARST